MAKKIPTYKELMSDKVMNSGKYTDGQIMDGLFKFKLVDPKDWMSKLKKKSTKKSTKKVARASTKSMNSSIPGDKRINNPKPKSTLTRAKLNMGGAANKKLSYGGLKGGKRKKKM